MDEFIYSDLAFESARISKKAEDIGEEAREFDYGFARLLSVTIDSDALAKKHSRPCGRYYTVTTDKIYLLSDAELLALSELLGESLAALIKRQIGIRQKSETSILAVGLGNSDITPDSIGPKTVSRLTVTNHIAALDKELFSKLSACKVAAFIPGVAAQTGIETVRLIKGAVRTLCPDVVVAVDALAASSLESLGATVQLTDTGITPGSGIGNMQSAINKQTLGVPVIAVGVPTVVDSATLVCDTLMRSGTTELYESVAAVLDKSRGFFVSPKEVDLICESVSSLLAKSLDVAFSL